MSDTTRINAMISNATNHGLYEVGLPSGNLRITAPGIKLKTGVWLHGSGIKRTVLSCSVPIGMGCIGKDEDEQLIGAHLSNLSIIPASSLFESSTVIKLGSVQQSEFSDMLIEGFRSGSWLDLGGVRPTKITDTNLGSNVIWNSFHDIVIYGCGRCAKIQGEYASRLTAPNYPDQVVTQNRFDNINMFYVQKVGWDLIRAVDTNMFYGGLINLVGEGSTGVMSGDEPGHLTDVVYVGNNKFFGLAFSHSGDIALTLFGGGYSTGTEGYGIETDINSSLLTRGVSMPNATSYRFCGNARFFGGPGQSLGCSSHGVFWQQDLVVKPTDRFKIKVARGIDRVILDSHSKFFSGEISLPCDPPNRQNFVVLAAHAEIKALSVLDCAGAALLDGASIFLASGHGLTLTYVSDLEAWVRL